MAWLSLALQEGPVVLVGHSYAGAVISVAGNDDKVAGLVFVAAFAPDEGESVFGISKPYPPAPIGTELRPDPQGFLSVTPKGIMEDFAQDFSEPEEKLLVATQGPTNVSCFGTNLPVAAAWKTKPDWFVVAADDRVIPPDLERAEAAAMKATTITLNSSHVAMLSHPKEVADLIEQAAAEALQKVTLRMVRRFYDGQRIGLLEKGLGEEPAFRTGERVRISVRFPIGPLPRAELHSWQTRLDRVRHRASRGDGQRALNSSTLPRSALKGPWRDHLERQDKSPMDRLRPSGACF